MYAHCALVAPTGLMQAIFLLLTRLMGVDPMGATLDWIGMQVQPNFLGNSKLEPTDMYFSPVA